ncbi:penicillin-binding protein activator [Magnetococcus sp. PR-3]|uniref:penicillin-binding protein activator n=1 Tax=Magnetococcus sp. PR-3 TaxID=3120355 RepID=UPI002FCE66E9
MPSRLYLTTHRPLGRTYTTLFLALVLLGGCATAPLDLKQKQPPSPITHKVKAESEALQKAPSKDSAQAKPPKQKTKTVIKDMLPLPGQENLAVKQASALSNTTIQTDTEALATGNKPTPKPSSHIASLSDMEPLPGEEVQPLGDKEQDGSMAPIRLATNKRYGHKRQGSALLSNNPHERYENPELPAELIQWQRYLNHYLTRGALQDTMTLAYAYPADTVIQGQQAHLTWRMIRGQSPERLEVLLKQQPTDRPLITPYLALALGDARWKQGDQQGARKLWQMVLAKSRWTPLTREARHRLTPDRNPTMQLGLLLPLTGQYGHLGNNALQGVQQALADYPDVPLSLFVGDTKGDEIITEKVVRGLVDQGVELMLGPIFHYEAATAARTAVTLQRPIIVLNPRKSIANIDPASRPGQQNRLRWIYLNAFDPEQQARDMAHYAVKVEGRRRIAFLAPDSDFGKLSVLAFRNEAIKLGATVLEPYYFPEDSRDFSPWLKKMVHVDRDMVAKRLRRASRYRSLDPADPPAATDKDEVQPWADFDAIFLPVPAHQARLIAPQLAFYNVRTPSVSLLGMPLWNSPELMAEGTDYLKGAVFTDLPADRKLTFDNNYRRHWQQDPSTLAMLAYDSVVTVAQLMRDMRMEKLNHRYWLSQLSRGEGFAGITGPLRYMPDGRSVRSYPYYEIGDGKIIPVVLDDEE